MRIRELILYPKKGGEIKVPLHGATLEGKGVGYWRTRVERALKKRGLSRRDLRLRITIIFWDGKSQDIDPTSGSRGKVAKEIAKIILGG